MWWTVMIAMQAAGPPDLASRSRATPATRKAPCPEQQGDDIVVCGARDQESFRLRPPAERFATVRGLPRAQVNVAGAALSAESEAGQAAGRGAPPRAMVRLKMKF